MTFNYLSIAAGLLYIVLGIYVIVYKSFIMHLDAYAAYGLGGLLIAYGVFRIGRAILAISKSKKGE